ncbi:DUF885 family protein [Aquisediminimonas profunda]|uniref:DUF885 family protein n=1 Tax=Aquisediminimonas profunda TaxID=1550733 RepID=UPI001C627FF4|nr:DUF885 family protein [Aquisediminimonas profunda]
MINKVSEHRPDKVDCSPRVRIVTDLGDMLVELYPDRAPKSVEAFLSEVAAGAYDGGSIARIVRRDNDRGTPLIEVIQGAAKSMKPNEKVEHESTLDTGLNHQDGTISLPRLDGGLGNAQGFFICIGAQPALDAGGGRTADGAGFAAFGRVVAGMDVARAIHALPTHDEAPAEYLRGQIAVDPLVIHRMAVEATAASGQLADLAADYWHFRVREFPTEASAAGIRSENRKLDKVAVLDFDRRARLCGGLRDRAQLIDIAGLDVEQRTTLVLLTQQVENFLAAHRLDEHRRAQLFPFGFANLPMGLAQQTALDTLVDRDDFLARMEALPAFLETNLASLSEGFRRGYRVPSILLPRILTMLDADLDRKSGLGAVIAARFAPAIAGADAAQLESQRKRAASIVADAITPALRAIRDAMTNLGPELCDAIGLSSQPGGRDYYRFKVRQQTSTDLDPDAIHAIGLDEVARIHGDFEAVLAKMGRTGERAEVAAELEAKCAVDAETLLSFTRAFAKRVDGLLPRLFGRMPRITYGVEPMTVAASGALPPALAQPAPADRSMPGIYWLTALPEKAPLHLIPALTLHEAWPGHLMQFSIAHELKGLPDFRRYTWQDYNGYVEGWALYSEMLGHDLGLYDDPADQFGLLSFELWRACRLVVDTGIHWLGWSRERAIDYLVQNSFLPRATCESEVDRYIGMPAQALSYKIGERVIRGLRADAEALLGESFSLRAFHDMILSLGPVSLAELESRTRAWIASSIFNED